METWDFLDDDAGVAAHNMAVDEALLLTAADRAQPLLRRYTWTLPSLSFGYFQRYPQDQANGRVVVRRPTGGGVVYHGTDTTYTVVVPPGHWLFQMPTAEAYCAVHRAVAAACAAARVQASPSLHAGPLHSLRGQYECFAKPVAGDVVAEGRKLAGGAQRRTKGGLLHQGSIAAEVSPEALRHGFAEELKLTCVPWTLPAAVAELAGQLAQEKYGTDAWNHRVS